MTKLFYEFINIESLTKLFFLIREIYSEVGVYPSSFTFNEDVKYKYDKTDALFVEKGVLSEKDYLDKYLI